MVIVINCTQDRNAIKWQALLHVVFKNLKKQHCNTFIECNERNVNSSDVAEIKCNFKSSHRSKKNLWIFLSFKITEV